MLVGRYSGCCRVWEGVGRVVMVMVMVRSSKPVPFQVGMDIGSGRVRGIQWIG